MTAFELALVLTSALLHAAWSAAIKGSGDPLVFNALQKVGPFAALLAVLPFVQLGEIDASLWRVLAATSVAHGLYFYWMGRAFERGDLTLVYPIARSTPAFLPFFAVPLLGERITATGAVGIAVVVAGIWCVQAGGGLPGPGRRRTAFSTPAARFAWLTLAATVAYSLLDKVVMEGLAASPWTSPVPRSAFFCLALYFGSAVVFTPLFLRRRGLGALRAVGLRDLARATLAASVSFVGYSLILHALETAPASYVVSARQTSVIFALLLGVVVLGESPGRLRSLGAVATAAGVALIAIWGS